MNHRAPRLICLLLLWFLAPSSPAQTDGQAEFQVTTVSAGGKYSPRNVMAIWVTDDANTFVKTLKKQASRREQYLYQWISDSNRDTVDGVTGATLSSHRTHNVTWDCRDTLEQIVDDGTYRIHVEFTDHNGQGPYSSSHVSFVKGTEPITQTYPNLQNFADLQVMYAPESETNLLVRTGAIWAYNDTGTDLHGGDWAEAAHDDTGWSLGRTRLGYGGDGATLPELSWGPDSSNKYPCYYFRHVFTSDHVPVSATLKVMMDDGVVVYLNGTEVARANMPAGATAYGDWATSGVSGSEEQQWHTFSLDPSLIAAGDNLIAAELHQSSATSSDIGFNLELKTGAPVLTPPVVGIARTPEGLLVEWDDGVLQFSPSLLAPDWQDMPGEASPYTPPSEQGSAWYRLKR